MTKLPQPQPTSSTRCPGCSASLVQTSSSFASCASSSVGASRRKPRPGGTREKKAQE